MKDRLTETIYEKEHYLIPDDMMESWFYFMRNLSLFEKDCGHLQIMFSDKFKNYKRIKKGQIWKQNYGHNPEINITKIDGDNVFYTLTKGCTIFHKINAYQLTKNYNLIE